MFYWHDWEFRFLNNPKNVIHLRTHFTICVYIWPVISVSFVVVVIIGKYVSQRLLTFFFFHFIFFWSAQMINEQFFQFNLISKHVQIFSVSLWIYIASAWSGCYLCREGQRKRDINKWKINITHTRSLYNVYDYYGYRCVRSLCVSNVLNSHGYNHLLSCGHF